MNTLADFKKVVAKSDTIPHDLELLAQITIDEEESPFDEMDDVLAILPDEKDEIIHDTSYLSKEELADPDIQCNIEAINHVFELAIFVAKDDQSNLYGYWLGKENRNINNAPIIQFDSEGQFSIMPGDSLTEALCGQYAFDDDELFTELKQQFEEIGITFNSESWEAVFDKEVQLSDDPAQIHLEVYNQERVKRGLPPVT